MLFWIKPLLCLLLLASEPTFAWNPDDTTALFRQLLKKEYEKTKANLAALENAAKKTQLHAYLQRLLSQSWDNDPKAVDYFHWISSTLENTESLGPIESPSLWPLLLNSNDTGEARSYRLHLANQVAFSMVQHPPAFLTKDLALVWLLKQRGPLSWHSLAYMNAFSEWKRQMREKLEEKDEASKNLLQMLSSIERGQIEEIDFSFLEKIFEYPRFIRFFINQLVLSMTPQHADKTLKSREFFRFLNSIKKQNYFRQDYSELFALSVELFRNTSSLQDKLKTLAIVLSCVQGELSDADKNLNPINLKAIQELFGTETNPMVQTFQSLHHLADFYDQAKKEELHSIKAAYLNTARILITSAKLYRTTAFILYIHDPLTNEATARISMLAFGKGLLPYFEDIPKPQSVVGANDVYDSKFMVKVACIAALTGGAVTFIPYLIQLFTGN